MLRESGVNEDVEFDVPAEFVEAEGGAESFFDFLSKAAAAEVDGGPSGEEEYQDAMDDAPARQQQAAAGSDQVWASHWHAGFDLLHAGPRQLRPSLFPLCFVASRPAQATALAICVAFVALRN